MVADIVQLRQSGNFDLISSQSASLSSRENVSNLKVSTLEGIMESLEALDLNMIGVCGPGGVGKTFLVKQIAMKAKEKLFDDVVYVTVSKTPDLKRIQQQIAASSGLNILEENLYARAAYLYERLMEKDRVLIILDDLWEMLDLHKIGIPLPKQKEGFKIIMTSRSQQVLKEMGTQKSFTLTTMSENEAWNLFKKEAGLGSTASPELLSIATEVATECARLPLAIVAIASALKDKDLTQWKIALQKLRDSAQTDVTGVLDAISCLEEDVESIFYICGFVMEDNLAKSDLFNYCVGLGLFEDIDKIKDVQNRFDTCISKLEDLQLLQQSNCREFLTMNAFVRDLAISLASQRHFMIRHQEGEKWPDGDKLENCTMIILSDRDVNELPGRLNHRNLRFLQLMKTDSSSKLPDNFFKGVRGLKVSNLHDDFFEEMPALQVLDLTAVKFMVRWIIRLEKLTTLYLDYCVLQHIEDIGKLKNLKVLSLSNSNIKKLPQELGQLTQLQFLDLSYCFQLEEIPRNVFSSLEKLQVLHMLGSFDDWDVNEQQQSKASIFELANLPDLTTLEVIIPDERMLPGPEDTNRLFGSLKQGKVLMGRQLEFRQFFEHETPAALKLWLSSAVTENIKTLLPYVDHLGIGNLEGAKNIVPQLNKEGFPRLKYLFVGQNKIQYIADLSGDSSDIDLFPTLESLVLRSLMNLEKLCSQSFSRLKYITVRNCNKVKSLFSFSLVRGLPHLLQIDLEYCYSMEGIVSDGGNAAIDMLEFPELQNLSLKSLPELVVFRCEEINGNNNLNLDIPVSFFCHKVAFPKLEKLNIKSTEYLKAVWQCSQLVSNRFGKLKEIDIRFCANLEFVFPYEIVSTLVPCLETLTVAHCESLQEIVMTQDNPPSSSKKVDDVEEIVFGKLKLLELDGLTSLTSFCSKPITLRFPSLDQLIISKCPLMRIFSGGYLVMPAVTKPVLAKW
ncbi:hypothetical protein L6164_003697 [Bauhinia variegata]|uniref:Uncharacterized protein n=1 Tax=Bauhinia variegata TaxID=167791 RepID=A0ACB9Q264_BAUVA|nr:hypothetical protein L6164_003697 [Bauhinia variegata]